MADAEALVGRTADITEWQDDEFLRKVTYPAAGVTGIIDRIGPYLVIETTGAEVTDAKSSPGMSGSVGSAKSPTSAIRDSA